MMEVYLWHQVTMMIFPPGAQTLTSSFTASDTDALKSPVLRSLGTRSKIFRRSGSKFGSSNLSASSRTKRSNKCLFRITLDECKTSESRFGVPTSTFGLSSESVAKSSASFVRPPMRSCGIMYGPGGISCAGDPSASSETSCGGLSFAAEGAWKSTKDLRTSKICVANSLVGATTMLRTWPFLFGSSAFSNRSTRGMRKASVFPLPVTA